MEDNKENLGKLAMKISKIASEIGKVEAEGHNKMGAGYDFVGYEQVNAILKNQLLKHKVAIIPSFESMQETVTEIRKAGYQGKPDTIQHLIRTIVTGTATVMDCETGESMVLPICGADQDYSGKSGGQAITEAVKRFELKLFHISTKADVDSDNRDTGATQESSFVTPEQVKAINDLMAKTGANEERFLKYLSIPSINQLPQNRLQEAIAALNKKEASNGATK